ncbi:hypothetical protein THASP1DRAFT_21856 [Thamnocephalis sphaerospora]|uniref:RING-type domain-containing protein n=1 Tax=Thamnocephalis sphaerospora TaxID=78915 RepID=A0A4P9XVX8_9FUNG|nr:hypothetical protein THASP1DRAFT_21856 [Thamnocephalis sphaerospora]|eukprot:RKP10453.1 hypothetical protein THASP1DRAFT_21856 [Thamnocephalis sphaerospora]
MGTPFPPSAATPKSALAAAPVPATAAAATVQETVLTDLQQALRCGICLDQLRDPRTLPCQHTFCGECLQLLIEAAASAQSGAVEVAVRCPLKCATRLSTRADAQAARRLPVNYVVARVLEATSQLPGEEMLERRSRRNNGDRWRGDEQKHGLLSTLRLSRWNKSCATDERSFCNRSMRHLMHSSRKIREMTQT